MATNGQIPTVAEEMQDELHHFSFAGTPASTTILLGVAHRDMWFSHATARYGTAAGSARALTIRAVPSGVAVSSLASNSALSDSTIDLNTTTLTPQYIEGTKDKNFIAKGSAVYATIPTSVGSLAGLLLDVWCETMRK